MEITHRRGGEHTGKCGTLLEISKKEQMVHIMCSVRSGTLADIILQGNVEWERSGDGQQDSRSINQSINQSIIIFPRNVVSK